jgi:hypothetical protein
MLPLGLQEPQSPQPITYFKLLIVEGRTPFEFFKALLRHLNLLDQVEVRNMGGNDDLGDFIELIQVTPGFDRVTSLGVVRDAEGDVASAFAAVRNCLSRVGLPKPESLNTVAIGHPAVSVFILPDCVAPGMLETLCWQSVNDDPAVQCVNDYFECLEAQGVSLPVNRAKASVHAFLSSRSRPDLLVGQAAHVGYWPWDNPVFGPLKSFLQNL